MDKKRKGEDRTKKRRKANGPSPAPAGRSSPPGSPSLSPVRLTAGPHHWRHPCISCSSFWKLPVDCSPISSFCQAEEISHRRSAQPRPCFNVLRWTGKLLPPLPCSLTFPQPCASTWTFSRVLPVQEHHVRARLRIVGATGAPFTWHQLFRKPGSSPRSPSSQPCRAARLHHLSASRRPPERHLCIFPSVAPPRRHFPATRAGGKPLSLPPSFPAVGSASNAQICSSRAQSRAAAQARPQPEPDQPRNATSASPCPNQYHTATWPLLSQPWSDLNLNSF